MEYKRSALEKSLRTRAKNQREKAKALKDSVKGIYTPEAKAIRQEAKRLQNLAQKNTEKAKQQSATRRAAQRQITPGEQKILDKTRTTKARETKASKRISKPSVLEVPELSDVEITLEADDTYIDTVLQRMASKFSGAEDTQLYKHIAQWVLEKRNIWGVEKLNAVLSIALEKDENLFDDLWKVQYYKGNNGPRNTEADMTLNILEYSADEYFEEYKIRHYDEEQLGINTVAISDDVIE